MFNLAPEIKDHVYTLYQEWANTIDLAYDTIMGLVWVSGFWFQGLILAVIG